MPAVQEYFRAAKAQFNGEPGGLGVMTQSFEELTTRQLGAFGKNFVAEMLEGYGRQVIVRNKQVGRYELDFIAEDINGRLRFVEVKT